MFSELFHKGIQTDTAMTAQALGIQDRTDGSIALVQIIIDQHIIILGPVADFI